MHNLRFPSLDSVEHEHVVKCLINEVTYSHADVLLNLLKQHGSSGDFQSVTTAPPVPSDSCSRRGKRQWGTVPNTLDQGRPGNQDPQRTSCPWAALQLPSLLTGIKNCYCYSGPGQLRGLDMTKAEMVGHDKPRRLDMAKAETVGHDKLRVDHTLAVYILLLPWF